MLLAVAVPQKEQDDDVVITATNAATATAPSQIPPLVPIKQEEGTEQDENDPQLWEDLKAYEEGLLGGEEEEEEEEVEVKQEEEEEDDTDTKPKSLYVLSLLLLLLRCCLLLVLLLCLVNEKSTMPALLYFVVNLNTVHFCSDVVLAKKEEKVKRKGITVYACTL